MTNRIKHYCLRMTEEDFERLEKLSRKLNMSKSKIIRLAIKSADMSLLCLEEHRERIQQAYYGGFTHADTDSIKSTKPNIEPIGGAKN